MQAPPGRPKALAPLGERRAASLGGNIQARRINLKRRLLTWRQVAPQPRIGGDNQGGFMHSPQLIARAACALTFVLFAAGAAAQAPQRPSYGPGINLETAKKVAAGAAAEAKKNNWPVAIAIVDNHGLLIYYEMMDDTQTAGANAALEKAKTSAGYRRASKEFEDNVAGGRVSILGLPGVTPIDGGLPILVAGKMVGAIGISGMAGAQDGVVAKAGVDGLTK
jgi:glc operon protein GlcG